MQRTMINGLDLFSGYGGLSRALSPWLRTVAYCENNYYRQLMLLCEMQRGRLDRAPIWDDVSTLQKRHIGIEIDAIIGGWPCTGHSLAGSRTGLDHVESKLAYELIRCFREFRPRFGFLENVPGVLVSGLSEITEELAALGYVGRYMVMSCPDVGPAWHERRRVWIALADASRIGSEKRRSKQIKERKCEDPRNACLHGPTRDSANTMRERLEGWFEPVEAWKPLPFVTAAPGAAWPEGVPEPTLCGKDDGPAQWVCQIETLGGGVVPQVAREAFKRLMGI